MQKVVLSFYYVNNTGYLLSKLQSIVNIVLSNLQVNKYAFDSIESGLTCTKLRSMSQ